MNTTESANQPENEPPKYKQPPYEPKYDKQTGYVRCRGCGVTLSSFGLCPKCNGKNFWTREKSYIYLEDSDTEGVTATVTRYQEDNAVKDNVEQESVEEETETDEIVDDEKMTATYYFSCGNDLQVTMTETQLENLGNGVVEFGVMLFAFWLKQNPGVGLRSNPPKVNEVKDFLHDLATRY